VDAKVGHIAEKMQHTLQPGYLSLKKAAAWADVSQKTIKRWIAAGLPVYQSMPGGKVLVKPQEIDQFLQKRQAPQIDVDALVNETLKEMGQERKSAKGRQVTVEATVPIGC
jgi:predicted site-specific integrase-resolvase